MVDGGGMSLLTCRPTKKCGYRNEVTGASTVTRTTASLGIPVGSLRGLQNLRELRDLDGRVPQVHLLGAQLTHGLFQFLSLVVQEPLRPTNVDIREKTIAVRRHQLVKGRSVKLRCLGPR